MPCCFLLMIDSAPTTGSTCTLLLFAILPLLDDDVFVLEDFELCEPILMIVSMIAVLNYQSFCCISMREFKRVMVFDNNTPTRRSQKPKIPPVLLLFLCSRLRTTEGRGRPVALNEEYEG